jgi:ABC-type bacteriocin/lantibiotic exporter with double-glycine peptidase domain
MVSRHEASRVPRGAIKVELPHVTQHTDATCGPAALLSIAAYYGVGPGEERRIAKDLGMDPRTGSHPHQLARLARRYGLRVEEHQPMAAATLRRCLDRRRPVLLMLQAWGGRRSYARAWMHGHWVVAIGHDRAGVYFMDPVLELARGFLSHADLGPRGVRLQRYGMSIWKPGARAVHLRTARAID